MSPKPWENAEGYADPTAYNAIKKVSAEGHEALDAKVNTLIKVLKFIIAESGFELVARIELRDRKTGIEACSNTSSTFLRNKPKKEVIDFSPSVIKRGPAPNNKISGDSASTVEIISDTKLSVTL